MYKDATDTLQRLDTALWTCGPMRKALYRRQSGSLSGRRSVQLEHARACNISRDTRAYPFTGGRLKRPVDQWTMWHKTANMSVIVHNFETGYDNPAVTFFDMCRKIETHKAGTSSRQHSHIWLYGQECDPDRSCSAQDEVGSNARQ